MTARPLLLPNSSSFGSVQANNMASWFTGRRTRKELGGFGRAKRGGKYRHNFKSKGGPLFKSQETHKTRVIRSMVNELFQSAPN